MPSLSPIRVAIFPPPCTKIFFPFTAAKSSRNDASDSASSSTLPPILIMKSFSIGSAILEYTVAKNIVYPHRNILLFFAMAHKHFTQHRLGSAYAIAGLLADDGVRSVQHFIRDDEVTPYRKAMHYPGIVRHCNFFVCDHPRRITTEYLAVRFHRRPVLHVYEI